MLSARDANEVVAEYATALLAHCHIDDAQPSQIHACHPDIEWAASGAMELTGFSDGPPLLAPGPLASAARASIAALASVAREARLPRAGALDDVDGPALLGERAAVAKLTRRGTTSPGGRCHLLRCADGWLAVNLARPEDLELLAAWLEDESVANATNVVARLSQALLPRAVAALAERARLLGLPVAEAAPSIRAVDAPLRLSVLGQRRSSRAVPPRVIDLSSLWAGPLATHLLGLAGASVIKVESARRPDGSRRGPREFHDLMNGGKDSVAVDLTTPEGVRALQKLVASADIVVESSRPRALRQLGIDAERAAVEHQLVWVSITGYGRGEPECERVAFGDDAGAAAGLAMALAYGDGVPVFCADAIADPLAGTHAALAALACWWRGESAVVDLALRDVAAYAARFPAPTRTAEVRPVVHDEHSPARARASDGWQVVVDGMRSRVLPPRARPVACTARDLGADTERVLAELPELPC